MTDAVESMSDVISKHSYQVPHGMELVQAILAAIQADPLAYVKPKPLEWDEIDGSHVSWNYEIYRNHQYGNLVWELWLHKPLSEESILSVHPSLEAAQSAAYDDLCKRVKELF